MPNKASPLYLSSELAALVGAKEGQKLSKRQVVKKLWEHAKENNLQDPEDKMLIIPDKEMQPIFGKGKLHRNRMYTYLNQHMSKEK